MGLSLRGLLHIIGVMHASRPPPQAADDRTRLAMLRLFYEQSGVCLVAAALLIVVHLAYGTGRVATPWLVAWAMAFALLHVPVYGWHVLPLDLAVGCGLGALRLLTGGVTAPAVAHVGADLAGWWLQ